MHSFTFSYENPHGQSSVEQGFWEILYLESELEELRIHTRRNHFDIILGFGFLGRFVYLPDIRFGFPADNLSDTSVSINYMHSHLGFSDALAVAIALKQYVSCYVQSNKVFSC